MNEKEMTLLRSYDFMRDIDGWFWSEKLDGCRAYWDGSQFWTRGGNVIQVPGRILSRMPKGTHVDGEIWAGRGGFEKAKVAVEFNKWSDNCDFVAFDFPEIAGDWSKRMRGGSIFDISAVKFGVVSDMEKLGALFSAIQSEGGEGLVVRNPEVKQYERKRTWNVLRIKNVF